MNAILLKRRFHILAFATMLSFPGMGRAQVTISPPNYSVTTPPTTAKPSGFQFDVNGTTSSQAPADANVDNSLNFSLNAGATYIFSMNTANAHPVDICTAPTAIAVDPTVAYSGASAQTVNVGTVTVTIPATNYPTTLYYICDNHQFYGIITVNPPQPPPPATIIGTSVTTNIVLTFSGGTNTIQMIPQFSSNLVNGVWLPVPSYTNTYSGNGTNTTSFSRLDPICGPDVFLRISQAAN
jgi:hypothetical protein